MSSLYLLVASTGIVVLIAIGLARRRQSQRRQAFKHLLEQHQQSGLALVRFVMINRHCSEEQAYERIAAFVKTHFPLEDQSAIDRQGLLDQASNILASHPNEIDKI